LKHGQTITIKGVQPDYEIEIEEVINDYYSVSFKDSKESGITPGKVVSFRPVGGGDGGERRFDFFNARKAMVPTGIADDSRAIENLLMISGLMLLAGAGIYKITTKRRRTG
jgi:hypothetical protein